jgi:sugar phosphate isomerase/epimerase
MYNRRTFIKTSAALATGLMVGSSRANEPSSSPKTGLRIGAPTWFSDEDPDAWAKNAREQRYRAVYAPNVPLSDANRIKAFREAAKKHDLIIAEVGRWVNMLDADPTKRAENIRQVTEGLALADELDARCCVDISGSYNPEKWDGQHPKNVSDTCYDETVENVRKVIDAVKPKRAKFSLEMMGWAIPDSTDSYLRLIKAIDRKSFGVHIDVCNMINSPDKFWNTTRLINEVFDKLGPLILSAHAKDLRWLPGANIHFDECVIGEGAIDFITYMKRLAALEQDVPLMIEHMKNQADYLKCRDHLFKVASETGITLA